MAEKNQRYCTVVLFGRTNDPPVESPSLFQTLTACIADALRIAGCKLTCRGVIEGELARNIAPRRGLFAPPKTSEWLRVLEKGRLKQFEIFDAGWREGVHPLAYGAVNRLWGYGKSGYERVHRTGVDNNMTLAINDSLIPSIEWMEGRARALAELSGTVYGFVETDIPWDLPVGASRMRSYMIDARWRDCLGDYVGSAAKVADSIPRLHTGNILSEGHCREAEARALQPGFTARMEPWGGGLLYVRFTRNPQQDREFHAAVSYAFNIHLAPECWLVSEAVGGQPKLKGDRRGSESNGPLRR